MSARYKISVITPSYNSGEYLDEAIQSVLIQNYPNFEHIVVDGGSNDGTLEILRKYNHLTWISEPDKGQSDAMNKGFKMSTGDIIVYLNSDDYFLPGAFNKVIPYFEDGSKFVVGTVLVKKDNGKSWLNDPKITHNEMLRHWENNAFCVNPVGYFYRREVQENGPGFSLENHFAMDLEFLLDCSLRYDFTKIQEKEPLGVFRYHEETKTAQNTVDIHDAFSLDNFTFIDKFLELKSPEFIKNYNLQRSKGFQKRIDNYLNTSKKKPVLTSLSKRRQQWANKLRDFARSREKMKIVREYFKRKFQ